MLSEAVESYLTIRRACGFALISDGNLLRTFAAFADGRSERYVCAATAIEWAGLTESVFQRARRLGVVIRFARHARAEDQRHEVPLPVFGREKPPRPVPYILSRAEVQRLVEEASQSGYRSLRRQTYSTLFALLACTGLRVSEAINCALKTSPRTDWSFDVPSSAKAASCHCTIRLRVGLASYIQRRRPYAPFDDHVFVSLRRKPLLVGDARNRIPNSGNKIGLKREPGLPRPTIHSFATRLQ